MHTISFIQVYFMFLEFPPHAVFTDSSCCSPVRAGFTNAEFEKIPAKFLLKSASLK
jgi:hypothetical protein